MGQACSVPPWDICIVSQDGTVNKTQIGLQYLSKLTPWNGRGGFDLQQISAVLKRLGDPQDAIPSVHVAGTNGKGSVSSAISSILGQAGYRVGLNSSPHLENINERIVIDGLAVADEFLGEFAYAVRAAAARELVDLSFHEVITAIAFLGFSEFGVEWSVMEVGLGGRLDASNVITRPAATAIVTIDYDHQAILGETLREIAAEKAGIIKAGSPVVTGFLPKSAADVVSAKAKAHSSELYRFSKEFGAHSVLSQDGARFGYWDKSAGNGVGDLFHFSTQLPGDHQGHNMAVAAKLGLLVGIDKDSCRLGVEGVFWPGRLETVSSLGREIVLDCAHNTAGIQSFISHLESFEERNIDLTFGVLDTKNWQAMIKQLIPYVGRWRLLKPESERAIPDAQIQSEIEASCNGISIRSYGSDYEGYLREVLEEDGDRPAYVLGSMYMVGRLRGMLSIPTRPIWSRAKKNNIVL